jgi:hypothetical protein
MRRLAIVVLLLTVARAASQSPDPCPHGVSEDVADALSKALFNAKSCNAAVDLFKECRWGSSADVSFAGIVIKKCERDYIGKLTPDQKKVYEDRMHLCNYQYDLQQGTLAISEAVSCHVDVAANFDADLQKASVPLTFASFNCKLAKSPLERAICSNAALGRADLVLSRVYSSQLRFEKGGDRATLIESERKWLRDLPAKCGLTISPPTSKTLLCLRHEFEHRFTLLDECEEDLASCLASDSSD